MLWNSLGIYGHLGGLALKNALIVFVMYLIGEPEGAVRGNAQIVAQAVHHKEVFCTSLDDFNARGIGKEMRYGIFEVVPGLHCEVLFLRRVEALFTSPELIGSFPRVHPQNSADFGRTDAAFAAFEPFGPVFISDYLYTHFLACLWLLFLAQNGTGQVA